jgi:hypothetical protein
MTNRTRDAVTEQELSALIDWLQKNTPLRRLKRADAEAVFIKLTEFGYSLTKEPRHPGNDLIQSDDGWHFLINRLLRVQSPLKLLNHVDASEVFRGVRLEGYSVVMPAKLPAPQGIA